MKISEIFFSFQQMMKSIAALVNTNKNTPKELIPLYVKNKASITILREREAERRQNQNNIL